MNTSFTTKGLSITWGERGMKWDGSSELPQIKEEGQGF